MEDKLKNNLKEQPEKESVMYEESDSFIRKAKYYNKDGKLVNELGFHEKVPLPLDIKENDVQLVKLPRGYKVVAKSINENSSTVDTLTYHSVEYSRAFDRPVKNVELEFAEGVVLVTGSFGDVEND